MRPTTCFSLQRWIAFGRSARSGLVAVTLLGPTVFLFGCDQTEPVQRGYRGMAMEQLYDPSTVESLEELNRIPEPEPRDPPDPEIPLSKDIHQNVQVLGDVNVLDFSRLMQAISTWVAPDVGCEYCHNTDDLASDEKYTKVVARRMLQMTRRINSDWKTHVVNTGVTCWTCHRGQPVPSGIWFVNPGPTTASKTLYKRGQQNTPGVKNIAYAALPYDPLSPFLNSDTPVPVQGLDALAGSNRHSIKQAEWTYSLMMYISNSLGVNCTYCHVTRSFGRWEEATPQRVTAWYGIRMVRELNGSYLNPLKPVFPPNRLGPEGDGPKVGCETCHKGSYKPLYGVSMLNDYPELAGVMPAIVVQPETPPEPTTSTP